MVIISWHLKVNVLKNNNMCFNLSPYKVSSVYVIKILKDFAVNKELWYCGVKEVAQLLRYPVRNFWN